MKMASDIDVDSAPAEPGLVDDLEGGQGERPFAAPVGQHLAQGLAAAIEPRGRWSGEEELAPGDGQPVALKPGLLERRVEEEADRGAPARLAGGEDGQVKAAALVDLGAEETGDTAGLGAPGGIDDGGGGRERKAPLARFH
ncbi:MAG: hypothetical protein BWY77_01783 [bacterium ADurb.Bin431]|nr:MAG: hypothetical protein BWY77_01783 [bacterium ADurb.Bin431]